MEPPSSYTAPASTPDIIIEDRGWRRLVPRLEERVLRSIRVAQSAVPDVIVDTVVLTDDRRVQRLNARHRGRNKPTNVLTFEPAGWGVGGEIVLALGQLRREAAAERKSLAQHLAHLLVHGVLHLDGEDHHHPGDARRMEMAESRILARLGVPNPWRAAR
ncbi:MAG TPA: rRNA maturation RNase YbeY [Acidisoma sp.]|uniref:rRNA maturation RNase YbeY n=1 Tax=Acidisoma sp. TaxID=1872115 RepID=UPI002B5ACA03|nr:rRNA maturation RNase YbeY [Acidisoma sp.]HTH99968.1 rRNA maturation RNase YbeY [Acidisoma sp.]